ncbi:MAG: hypothetical protein M3Y28_10035 [Armatimonadota bacterium]|nr:hypothetical protein [Armatimonadota bacterium]
MRGVIPGAKNTNNDGRRVWSFGQGAFVEASLADQLALRPKDGADMEHRQKGYVEPDAEVEFDVYQNAIVATRNEWNRDEQRNSDCPICGQP